MNAERALCHTLFILSHMHSLAQVLSLTSHPRSYPCAHLLESLLLFYIDLSFPVFFFSFHLLHCELYTELDNLIAMEILCHSADKGSNDAYDVSPSLTPRGTPDGSVVCLCSGRHFFHFAERPRSRDTRAQTTSTGPHRGS